MKCFLKRASVDSSEDFSCSSDFISRDSLSTEEIRTIHITSGCKRSLKFVCRAHHTRFLTSYSSHQRLCCDPLALHGNPPSAKKRKLATSRSLTNITMDMRDKAKMIDLSLIPGKKICVACRVALFDRMKQVSQSSKPIQALESSPSTFSSQTTIRPSPSVVISSPIAGPSEKVDNPVDKPYTEGLDEFNVWLSSLGLSPISEKKLREHKSYGKKTLKKLEDALQHFSKCTFHDDQNLFDEIKQNASYFEDMIDQLKDYINKNIHEPSKIILALSIIPKSWSYSKIEEQFGVSNHLARKSRQLLNMHGILTTSTQKLGRSISEQVESEVKKFYLRSDISRELPGKKDIVSVKENGVRVHKRKRLVLSTLQKLHEQFTSEFPTLKISLTKFTELRPKECVLAGRAGTHIVCVCVIHQNPKLMFQGTNLRLTGLNSVGECQIMILCSEPTISCYLRKCEHCPTSLNLQEKLEVFFDSEMIDFVTYNQWESTDRSTIETITKSTEDFVADFTAKVNGLITHDFIYRKQSQFYKDQCENLEEGQIVVNLDFAENYSFIVQDSAQSFYFNNRQATIHPLMTYFKSDGEDYRCSYVIISDHMEHSTAAVNAFQKKLIGFLKDTCQVKVKKLLYFSDGCASHYKNKKAVSNIWFHERDFGVAAEWHYFATSHGKSPCDGLGGTVKHQASLHSLRSTTPGSQITTPLALFNWAEKTLGGIHFGWVSSEEVQQHSAKLEMRFATAYSVSGIQSSHAIIPKYPEAFVEVKLYSSDESVHLQKICTKEFELEFSDVRGFVAYTTDWRNWQLGSICEKHESNKCFSLQVLQPSPKAQCFAFSDKTVTIKLDNILTLVTPLFQNKGKLVKLLINDIKAADIKLREKHGV